MRLVEQLPEARPLEISDEYLCGLKAWLAIEIEDALSSRAAMDALWRDLLRQYEGVPRNPTRNHPVENAPNIEITLGAIASDSIYAQLIDLIYTANPLLTVRSQNAEFVDHAKALQRFSEIVIGQSNLRSASEHVALDDVQLGTGCYYIPWIESVKKTRSSRVTDRRPHIFSIPVEDLIVPGGAFEDIQLMPWVGLRFWHTQSELNLYASRRKWKIDAFKPAGGKDFVRTRREDLGHTYTKIARATDLYETITIFCAYDIDGDGIDEDLLVVWDRTSRDIGLVTYNPFDRRPIEPTRYQLRAHLFYGLGVMEMIRPYQDETSEIHNARTLNMLLANCRFWKAREGSVPETMKIWGNKVQMLSDPTDLIAEQMADIYPSAAQAQAITTSLAERRVGVNEMSMPRPSQVLGSRTPGITAMSLLQQVNRRFTPAFDGYRNGTGAAVKQCLYRYQERLLAGDRAVEEDIMSVMGDEDGRLVIDVLRDDKFDEGMKIELTASSASVNRDADRQNSIMLVNLLAQYYQRTLELVSIAA